MNVNKLKIKNKIYNYSIICIALLISAICYNLFLFKLDIVSGGANGIATIAKKLFHFDQSFTLLAVNIFFLIISRIFLGKEKTVTIIAVSLIYPLFVKLTDPLIDIVRFSTNDMFIVVIFAGLLSGLSNGLIYKIGYNMGGVSVLCQVLHEKLKVSLSWSVMVTNLLIIGAGALVFGPEKAMYAIIQLYISNLIMDKVLLGISNNKAFYIVTSEPNRISRYIIEILGHNTTQFEVKGGFLDKRKNVILSVVPTRDYYKIKEGIKLVDDKAFIVVTDSYEVKGAK